MATHGVRCSPCIWGPQESACRGDPSHNYPTMTDSPYTTILRILNASSRKLSDLQAAMPGYANARIAEIVEKMKADGLIVVRWRRLELTKAGRAAAPSSAPNLAHLHGTYVPPRVVCRSRAEHVPSRYGDTYVYGRRI